MSDKIFDENSLREAIVRVWGEYGAHVEVYDMLLKKLNELQTPPPDAAVHEAAERASSLVTFGSHNVVIENKHIVSLLRAVQSPRLTGEQMEVVRMLHGMADVHGVFRDEPGQELECVVRAAFPEAFAGGVGRG